MSDDADLAQAHLEAEEVIRRKYSKKPVLEVEPTGECLNCYEPVPFGARWCDKDCRQDWHNRKYK